MLLLVILFAMITGSFGKYLASHTCSSIRVPQQGKFYEFFILALPQQGSQPVPDNHSYINDGHRFSFVGALSKIQVFD